MQSDKALSAILYWLQYYLGACWVHAGECHADRVQPQQQLPQHKPCIHLLASTLRSISISYDLRGVKGQSERGNVVLKMKLNARPVALVRRAAMPLLSAFLYIRACKKVLRVRV